MLWPGLDAEGTQILRADLCPQHTSDWVWEEVGTKGNGAKGRRDKQRKAVYYLCFHPTFT